MEINVNVQYNGGLLPDIILLTRCGYIGELVRYHEEVLSLQPMFLPKPLDIFPPEGGCSEGLAAFRFFSNNNNILRKKKLFRQRWESNHRRRHCYGFNLVESLKKIKKRSTIEC